MQLTKSSKRYITADYNTDALVDAMEREIKRLWWYMHLQRRGEVSFLNGAYTSESVATFTRDALTSLLDIRATGQGRLSYWTRREMAELAHDMEWEWKYADHSCDNPLCPIDGDPRDTSIIPAVRA